MDLVFFVVEGREALFLRTLNSLPMEIRTAAQRILVACDGAFNLSVLEKACADIILVAPRRRGYIHSIFDVLQLVQSDFFIWIEDDWRIEKLSRLDIDNAVDVLRRDRRLIQVRWAKEAPLPTAWPWLGGQVRQSLVGFSANPNICNTLTIREGFRYISERARIAEDSGFKGFEEAISEWAIINGYIFGVIDPGCEPMIFHEGELETTGREWHMVQSLNTTPRDYGFIGISPRPLKRIWMFFKVIYASILIAFTQLKSDAHYDLAFRITRARRKVEKSS